MDKTTPVGIDAGITGANMSKRKFLSTGIQGLLGLAAANATGVLGQTLPRTYDEIMAALAAGKLTYQQLFDACSQNAGNFNETQKTVLKGKLAELKLQAQKPILTSQKNPPINETKEQKAQRLAIEKENKLRQEKLEGFNKDFMKQEGWNFNPKNSGDAKIKKEDEGISIEFKERDKTKPNQNSFTAKVHQLVPGEYNLSITAVGLNMTAIFQGAAEQVLGRQPLTKGDQKLIIPQGTLKVLFANENTPLSPKTLISKMTLSLPMENGKQVVVGNADGKK